MRQFLLRRLILGGAALLGLSLLAFGLVRIIPGDAVMAQLAESGNVSDLAAARAQLGLDRPFAVQYVTWLGGVVRGDLGTSFWSKRPVMEDLLAALPVSVELAVIAMLLSMLVALPLGAAAASHRGGGVDLGARLLSFGGLSVPHFWIATLVLLYGSIWFRWVPPLGYVPPGESLTQNLEQFMIPAAILGLHLSARSLRLVRSSLLEALQEDYIRTAWAKGLRGGRVLWGHALRNALIPILTILGGQFTYLLSGSVIIEDIFSLSGIGRYVVESITHRDYPAVQGAILFTGLVVIGVNLAIDLAYAWADPRIRYQ
ncbi:MAG TPA: ABC transporter permease [bacterium]|nr:ABC transporter permease [bacterium]